MIKADDANMLMTGTDVRQVLNPLKGDELVTTHVRALPKAA